MKQGSQAGFTLLEMLVALAVLGMLTAGLAQGLRTGIAAWQAQGRQLGAWGDFEAADRTLRALIARMDPGAPGGQNPTLAGSASTLTFQTSLPQAAAVLPTPDAEVTLAVDRARRLMLLLRPHYRKPLVQSPPQSEIPLLSEVERLDISYWEPTGGWRQDWAGLKIPKLIRIQVIFTRQSGRVVPAIIVRPMRDQWRQ